MKGYVKLSNAIVIRAAKDYRRALKRLRTDPLRINAQQTKIDCERFFCSEWFYALTKLDGNWLMKKLQKEDA